MQMDCVFTSHRFLLGHQEKCFLSGLNGFRVIESLQRLVGVKRASVC
jgi:hypothetical protein